MTTPHETDLHSEYLRADLVLAMGQPIEAARILEALLTAEPENQAVLELLARS
jgi:predicted Zn-dependent protease